MAIRIFFKRILPSLQQILLKYPLNYKRERAMLSRKRGHHP
ncbi:hypothetical protein MITSMUL_04947 [Mitsuokella multacida DSM 20544]|uniref:Uncharacterized protein n=1 Tax=Mitsuokella multacida DSM 20544 TaxID=500635 RepID=C9KNZ2_9FIRM|nr:hypothetical protein MITSMUL_04947 [Mitsuokella multacida DSM 20544]